MSRRSTIEYNKLIEMQQDKMHITRHARQRIKQRCVYNEYYTIREFIEVAKRDGVPKIIGNGNKIFYNGHVYVFNKNNLITVLFDDCV